MFTTRVTPDQAGDAAVAHTMHMFQQWAPKEYEVRLTVVDDQFFAARIDSRSDAGRVDWRADYRSIDYTQIDTPEPVRARVLELLNRLNLRFGAMDFVIAPDGDWWFLECNPNGQWAWIEAETAMPITATLADALGSRLL